MEKTFNHSYMGWDLRDEILLDSSSGGVFTTIAERIISDGGVVVGVEMNQESRNLCHVIIRDSENLYRIRKSKYYQSNSKDIYNAILNELMLLGGNFNVCCIWVRTCFQS